MKGVLSALIAALLSLPAMAADQPKQVQPQKPQAKQAENDQRLTADQKFVKDYNSGLAKSTCYPNCPKQNPPPNLFKAYRDKK